MRRFIISLAAAGATLSFVGSAAATTPHTHQITTGDGDTHQIAGGLCQANWETAGENFHTNVHLGLDDTSGQGATITREALCD